MKSNDTTRVRFAPSPTGQLHVGGVRTALYNYLFAKHTGGKFLLRIEDTDTERSKKELTERILESLEWLGLHWDEEIVYQSSRVEAHRKIAEKLLSDGTAYRCFCDPEDLAKRREDALAAGKTWKYDRACLELSEDEVARRISAGDPWVVRFKVPDGTPVTFDDLVYGTVSVSRSEIEDFVLLRRNGFPTYHLAVVADDEWMGITHVIRGDDHISNTPKQILLGEALGYSKKHYAHLPLIAGPDGRKLSKRHGATFVGEFREDGILPEALVNFMALLGWSPGDNREKMSLDELVDAFELNRVTRKMAVFDIAKLEWLNGRYLAEKPSEEILNLIWGKLAEKGLVDSGELEEERERLLSIIELLKVRARRVGEIVDSADYFFRDPVNYAEKYEKKHFLKKPLFTAGLLKEIADLIENDPDFSEESLERIIREIAEKKGIGAGKVIHPVRLACSGTGTGPGLFEMLILLGRETVVRRLKTAENHLRSITLEEETEPMAT